MCFPFGPGLWPVSSKHQEQARFQIGMCWMLSSLLLAACAPPVFVGQPVFGGGGAAPPTGEFYQAAWVNHDDVVFLFDEEREFGRSEFELYSYSLATGRWSKLNVGENPDCSSIERRWIHRLAENTIGYFQRCNLFVDGSYMGGYDRINAFSLTTGAMTTVIEYDKDFHAADYSIAPVDGRFLQLSISEQAYMVADQERERVFRDFERISSARWSPAGDRLAYFVAGLTDPLMPETNFSRLPIDTPYDLYLTDAPGNAARQLIKGVRYGFYLKWSPEGDRLAFRGEVAGQSGVWIYELESGTRYRVWDQRAYFDWSPDGERMIVISPLENGETVPLLIDAAE